MNTQLSPHFSTAELTHSDTALRLGIANTPNDEELLNLSTLCTTVAEPARAACRVPLNVDDGFRCDAVNKAVGGVENSAHRKGCAMDFRPAGLSLQEGFDRIRADESIPFDQIILEVTPTGGCIHISCAEHGKTPRRQALIRHGEAPHWTYTEAEPLHALAVPDTEC